jgi:DNA-binding transcriptional LysR family regulator
MIIERLNDLRLFIDAAALGSFSAAGRRQGLSPAAASAGIQRMEAALGARLFERTTRQLRLTDAGQRYRQFCQQALELLQEGEQQLQADQGQVRGTVRLSAPSDLGRNRLLRYLDAFRQQYPQVHLVLHLSDSTSDLISDDIDLAIRYGQPADSSMAARKLAPSRRVVCAAPALLARLGRPGTPEALTRLPCLVFSTASGPKNEWHFQHGGTARGVRLEHYLESNDGEIVRKWALQGQGFACKSLLDVEDDLRAGRLETVLDDYFTENAPLYALYPGGRFLPLRIRLLIDFLLVRFADTATGPTPATN